MEGGLEARGECLKGPKPIAGGKAVAEHENALAGKCFGHSTHTRHQAEHKHDYGNDFE